MKKILILANNDVGLYKFRKELIEELINPGSYISDRKGQEKSKVYISLPNGEFISELKKMGCCFINTPVDRRGMNPKKDLKLLYSYLLILKKLKPDIVFTYTIKPNIYGGLACSLKGIPYVANITGLGSAVENKGILQMITVMLYKLALIKSKTVFFQNKENESFFRTHKIAKGKHKMLPGSGVNLSQYRVLDYPNGDTIDFAFIARVMKEKGIDQYLEAAQYIRKKYPNTRFHICGFCEQDYEEKIERLNYQGAVIYHGLVSDMTEIYKTISCTIHPTYYPEGISNVLLESAACGRPIITTNRAGCREVVDDGVNGFVVRERDSRDLIDKIEKFMCLSLKERWQMGLAGRRKVEKKFNRQIVVEKYMAEIKR